MPFRIGVIAYPIGLMLLARKLPSPLAAFRKAGAFSPETARKPATLGLSGRYMFEDDERRGVVVGTGDGRFYLDPVKDRARRRRFWTTVIAITVATTPLVAWMLL